MESPYSKAFDHLARPDSIGKQGAHNVQQLPPEPVKRRTAVKKLSREKVRPSIDPEHDIMGQAQTTSEYIDIFDSEPHRLSQKHKEEWERANSVDNAVVTLRRDDFLRRGHRNEESEDYCYAYSRSVSREGEDEVDSAGPTKFQRSVSLKDDYSQPPDRLSTSGREFHGDYTEPYKEKMIRKGQCQSLQSPVTPDPGGIYELAKDIDVVPKPRPSVPARTMSSGEQAQRQASYHHLNSATNRLQQTNLADANSGTESYDHLWISSNDTAVSQSDSKTTRVTSPKTSSSSADEVFTSAPRKEIVVNYEEPWDSEEGQSKFTYLMKKAEKTDERRQSVDKFSGARPQVPAHKKSVDHSVESEHVVKKVAPIASPKVKREIAPSYEDAWDLPEKQREFEEKLEKARKSRTSQGQLSVDEPATDEKHPASVSPVNRRSLQEAERLTHDVSRSDSRMSLGAMAEKVDPSLPLEDQNFYHGTIKRSAAERLLLVYKDGSYLVRKSETSKNDYSLTLKGLNGLPIHMKISRTAEGNFILGENSPPFSTIPQMIDHYTCHKLPIHRADGICLLYPIPC